MSIYAILGVTFFGEAAPEHFGTFGASLLTNCQVGTRGWGRMCAFVSARRRSARGSAFPNLPGRVADAAKR